MTGFISTKSSLDTTRIDSAEKRPQFKYGDFTSSLLPWLENQNNGSSHSHVQEEEVRIR